MDHGSGTMRCKGQCGSGSLSPMIDNGFKNDNENDNENDNGEDSHIQ